MLRVPRTAFGDAGIEQLIALTRLSTFDGGATPITQRGAQSLSQIKSLRRVWLYRTRLDDSALIYLGRLPLTGLTLDGTGVTDAGLRHLEHCSTLASLGLDATAITDAGLTVLAKLPVLGLLHVRDTRITDRSVETLATMKSLTKLTLSDPPISQAGYQKLKETLPIATSNGRHQLCRPLLAPDSASIWILAGEGGRESEMSIAENAEC